MAQSTSPLHSQFSADPADRRSMELSSVLQSRSPYQRQSSIPHVSSQYRSVLASDGVDDPQSKTVTGLGIIDEPGATKPSPTATSQGFNSTTSMPAGFTSTMNGPRISRVAVGRKDSKVRDTPADPSSLTSSPYSSHAGFSDQELLAGPNSHHHSSPDLLKLECPTDGAIIGGRWSWLSISIIILAVYSTLVSAAYLGIALARPRYGKKVGTDGSIPAATIALLSTLFAKTVELSFVTVFVAFLGQVLSRRAFLTKARGGGISIAEMMMRTWIMQPGTLITHAGAAKYAALSFLGIIALLAAFMAMFYVTAAEALVSPKLRLGPLEDKVLYGKVSASFANPIFLAQTCPSPITEEDDPEFKGSTCLQIEHAGQAYHNYQLYLNGWTQNLVRGNSTGTEYATRPPPGGVMFDNTTVRGQWITPSGDEVTRRPDGILVQNLTMAMPHANVFNAARDPVNDILQPDQLNQGEGVYTIKASVPVPVTNVLCAGVEEEDIGSLIYVNWPTNNGTFDIKTWPQPPEDMIQLPAYPNATAIDDLFDFGPEMMGDARQRAPIFPKLPMPYNTLLNATGVWPAHSIYILAGTPPNIEAAPYVFCSLRATQYPGCTTRYQAAKAGGEMSVHCNDDPDNTMPYSGDHLDAPVGRKWEADWKNIASEWAKSLSLGTGITDGNASNTRMLTQMILKSSATPSLNPALPSIAEALGVLSGCTLDLSSLRAPFIHYWNYSEGTDMAQAPQYQGFNASLRYQDYASGPTERWQGIFYVVLFAVFATNCFCLVYLVWTIRQEGQITDYTEPQNLFALAVNSPPSRSLSGACGAGPEGDMLGKKWEVEMQTPADGAPGHPHFYVRCGDDDEDHHHHHHQHGIPVYSPGPDPVTGPKKRKSKMSLASVGDFDIVESPAVEQYKMLANRRKTLL